MFKQDTTWLVLASLTSFNPSVGILGVQAGAVEAVVGGGAAVSIPRSGFWVFKQPAGPLHPDRRAVSIPRSGFWVFKLGTRTGRPQGRSVSIPRSGFWVFKRDGLYAHHLVFASFNPSVGILGVQAGQ